MQHLLNRCATKDPVHFSPTQAETQAVSKVEKAPGIMRHAEITGLCIICEMKHLVVRIWDRAVKQHKKKWGCGLCELWEYCTYVNSNSATANEVGE